MQRYLIAFCVVTCLSCAFRVYSAIVEPLTALQAEPVAPLEAMIGGADSGAGAMLIQAERDFPDLAWAREASQEYHLSDTTCLYTRSLQQDPSTGRTIQVTPVAIVYHDPKHPEAPPLRIIADSGELEFENRFYDEAIALSDAKPGRIVAGQLNGTVHIDGPNGLVIDGHQFTFSEQSSQLYSDYPVRFEFGPTAKNPARVVGQGDKLLLTFQPAQSSILGNDLPRIGDPQKLMLRQNVELNAAFINANKPTRAHVVSKGYFQFDFVRQMATFDGGVEVERWRPAETPVRRDRCRADSLVAQFEKKAPAPGATVGGAVKRDAELGEGMLDDLEFTRLHARGAKASPRGAAEKVTLTSEKQNLTAIMDELTYEAPTRRIVMRDDAKVLVAREDSTLECPRVDLTLDEEDDPQRVLLTGAGAMRLMSDSLGNEPLTANWKSGASILPEPGSPWHVLHLDQAAQLVVPNLFGISATQLHLWVDLKLAMKQKDGGRDDALSKPLALKRAAATGDVVLASEKLIVKRSEYVEAEIQPGKLVDTPENRTRNQNGEGDAAQDNASPPAIVEADRLAVQIVHDPDSEKKIDVRRAEGVGRIAIQQERPKKPGAQQDPMQGALRCSGSRFVMDNEGGLRQTVSVFGDADQYGKIRTRGHISIGQAMIEGLHITLTRDENTLKVHGQGRMGLPATTSLSGQKLDSPRQMEVAWSESMAFDGLTARFLGNVTASVPDETENVSRLTCVELSARLNQRISFAEPDKRGTQVRIEVIEGRNNVELEAFTYDPKTRRHTEVRRGSFHAFEQQQSSGDFTLQGPGELHNWSYGDSVRFSPGDSAKANQPVKAEGQPWRYSKLSFEGNVVGNTRRNDAVVKGRVEFLTAPVDSSADVFHRDQLSRDTPQSANAAWLGCEELRLWVEAPTGSDRKFISLLAMGDSAQSPEMRSGAELEGVLFRATADVLEYHQQQGKFVLQGRGKKDAVLYYRQKLNAPYQSSSHLRIDFIPDRHEVQTSGSSGLSGGSF